MTLVIGLCGPAGAGKSTVASYLIAKYGAKHYSLAGPLKEIAKRVLDFSDEQLYGTQEQKEAIDPRYGFSARWFLQRLGTEGCRAVMGSDIWTRTCLNQIKADNQALAVIDDVRFIDEAEAIRFDPGMRGFVWRLEPPKDDETNARSFGAGLHASEQEWRHAPADLVIAPTRRNVDELFAHADAAMKAVAL